MQVTVRAIHREDLVKEMALTREDLEEILEQKLDKKLDPILKSVQFMSERFDEMTRKLDKLEQEKTEILRESHRLKSECLHLSNELNQVKTNLNDLEQYTRRDCLEIRGIPIQTDREDTDEIVKKVGEMVGVSIESKDISTSHRLPQTSRSDIEGRPRSAFPPTLIVKFTSRSVRDELYRARRHLKGKTTRDLHPSQRMNSEPGNNIFIAESLTKANKDLFTSCLKLRRELNYSFIWTNYGRIYMRKNTSSSAIHIANTSDLAKIKPRGNGNE